ncbi:MAG: extracellular solute-binding protein [candidate division Zixibacteria bacterium]|nr:extracellular solute-binding protein [candidate division Zixibacteria bacterium]
MSCLSTCRIEFILATSQPYLYYKCRYINSLWGCMMLFRYISIVIAVCLVLSCGGQKESNLVFTVGGAPAEIDFWEELADEFTAETGIKITVNRQPTDTDQRRQGLVVALKAESSDPDIFLMDVAWVAQMAASGWLLDLEQFGSDGSFSLEPFYRNVIELADRYNNKLIALPVYVDGGLLYYRADLLDRFGYDDPPRTWQELIEQAVRIQAEMQDERADFYGYIWQGAQYEGLICNFLEVAVSGGGGIVNQSGEIEINTEANLEALRMMRAMIADYEISPPNTYTEFTEEEVRVLFQQGKALFERNWPYAYKLHRAENSAVRDKFAIASLPHFEGGRSVATLGGWHIGISRFCDLPDQALEFVRFVTSYETQKKLALNLGWNPGRRDVYDDHEVLNQLPHFAQLQEIFENAYPRPTLPYYTQVSEVMQRYLNSALAGEMTPRDALRKADEEIETIVSRYSQ